MHLALAVAGLLVGFLVGLIGMGGGALLTPLLVLVFRVAPLAAIASDLLTSLVMMPVGAVVHLRCRTVDWRLVRWLTVGSVPAAFAGAMLIGSIGHIPGVQADLKLAIGIALCVSVGMTLLRQVLDRRASLQDELQGDQDDGPPVVYPLRTVAIGVMGGFAVGMTSVGGGSLVIALLLITYPRQLRPAQLAGTGLVQAIPLVATATVGHLLYGDVHLAAATSLLFGALPGVYLGARLSTRGPAAVIRPLIVAVLLASGLALLKVPTPLMIAAAGAGLVTTVLLRVPQPPAEPVRQPDPADAE
ncbi:MAG: sulfite exporter TauE/SafE family protein [Pseudonocardiaceae bacterium]